MDPKAKIAAMKATEEKPVEAPKAETAPKAANEQEPKDKQPTPKPKFTPPEFLPKLLGQKVNIRLVSGGQALPCTLEAFNAYELLVRTAKGQVVIPKHAVAMIEIPEPVK